MLTSLYDHDSAVTNRDADGLVVVVAENINVAMTCNYLESTKVNNETLCFCCGRVTFLLPLHVLGLLLVLC